MFNLFKLKRDSYIPKDIEEGLIMSNFCEIKINEKIVIPDNLVCILAYHNKFYNFLEAGTYTLDKKTLLNIYSKQINDKKPKQKIKCDFYFVNLKPKSYNFEFLGYVKINNKSHKAIFTTNATVAINSPRLFTDIITHEIQYVDNKKVNRIIISNIESNIQNFYNKQTLASDNESDIRLEELKLYLDRKLQKIGLNLNELDFTLTIQDKISAVDNSSFFNNSIAQEKATPAKDDKSSIVNISNSEKTIEVSTISPKNIDQNTNVGYNTNNDLCPRCHAKIIKNADYCHICGHRF